MQWLNENDDVSLEFLRNAYAKDKRDNVSICHVKIAKYDVLLVKNFVWNFKEMHKVSFLL